MRRAKRLPLEVLAPYMLEPPRNVVAGSPDPATQWHGRETVPQQGGRPARLNWREIFGNDHPVELEVGFGKGLYLLNACQACPDINFLGIEILRKYQLYAATRFAKRGLKNVRLVKADAREFLRHYVLDESFQAIHVYFPDPWWKKRHLKRRLFTGDFAAQCERTLQSGGRLHVVTDVADYFGIITVLLQQHTHLKLLPVSDPKEPTHDLDYLTNFERKFLKEGRALYRGVYERVTRAP